MKGRGDRFARGPAAYQRGHSPRGPSGKTFLIVTEGEKTEPNYLKAVRNRLELSAVDVVIFHPEGTDPLTLVREAVRLRTEQSMRAKRSLGVAYDEVWVVFDLEQTHHERRQMAERAKTLPEAAELRFAVSDPAFEYWLLLHEEYTTAVFKDGAAVIRRLKMHWSDYSKDRLPPPEFLVKVPQAVTHARRRRKTFTAPARPEHPFTDVDLLVCELNAATRVHLRFPDLPPPTSGS